MNYKEALIKIQEILNSVNLNEQNNNENTQEFLLKVPYVSQLTKGAQKYNNDCGAASGVMLIKAYKPEVEITVDKFYDLTGQRVDRYLNGSQIKRVLEKFHIPIKWEDRKTLEDLLNYIREGRPCIVLFNYGTLRKYKNTYSKFTGEHFSVVVGYTKDSIILQDTLWLTEKEGRYEIPFNQWKEIWYSSRLHGNPPNSLLVPMDSLFQEEAKEIYKVKILTDSLRVRSSPKISFNNDTKYRLTKGDIRKVFRESNNWLALNPEGTYWIASKYYNQIFVEKI